MSFFTFEEGIVTVHGSESEVHFNRHMAIVLCTSCAGSLEEERISGITSAPDYASFTFKLPQKGPCPVQDKLVNTGHVQGNGPLVKRDPSLEALTNLAFPSRI